MQSDLYTTIHLPEVRELAETLAPCAGKGASHTLGAVLDMYLREKGISKQALLAALMDYASLPR